jgi:hypothetical protein
VQRIEQAVELQVQIFLRVLADGRQQSEQAGEADGQAQRKLREPKIGEAAQIEALGEGFQAGEGRGEPHAAGIMLIFTLRRRWRRSAG